jgi:hypothetical protein
MEAVDVKATCETMADQPVKGGQSLAKKEEHTAKETFDGGPLAQFFACLQVGGRQERFFCRLGFQGTTAMAPSVAWIQWISCSPQ